MSERTMKKGNPSTGDIGRQWHRQVAMSGLVACLLICVPAHAQDAHASAADLLQQAQALRDAQQWEAALQRYREGMQQFPNDPSFAWGEIYALADGGQPEQAVMLAEQALAHAPDDPDALLVMAYAQLRHRGVYASLEYVDRAVQHAGNRGYVVREYLLALQRAHMADAALTIAQRHPQLLSQERIWELQADAIAQRVRFADLPVRSEAERFAIADRALAQYEQLLDQLQQAGQARQSIHQRARIDRLQVLHARYYMRELVQEYESLLGEGTDIPVYALPQVASAYLYVRQPEQSAQIYEQLIASGYLRENPVKRLQQDQGLLYAYADQGNTALAQHMAPVLASQYQPWLYMKGEKRQIPNASYLDAQHLVTMMDLYANATVQAQQRLQRMVELAPNNNNLRTDLAQLYRARGWPRLAEQELQIAQTYTPRALNVEIGQGFTALELQEWQQARALSADTLARFPEDLRSQRLARLWDVHNMAKFQLTGYKSLSDNNPASGGRDVGIEATVYSQPLADNWRVFAGAGHRSARFVEGKGRHNFARLGLEWRSRDWTMAGEVVDHHFGHGNRTGMGLRIDYSINDIWSVQAGGQWRSRDTNVRALHHNITSNELSVGVRWRPSERSAWQLTATPSDFSDGNRRWDVLLAGQQRLWTRPTWFVDGGLEVFATRNRRSDVPYYSPRREYSVLPSLSLHHTLKRRYETAWTQHLGIGAGVLHQHGFGSGAITSVSYGQRFQTNDVLELGATLSHLSRPYDGKREREWRLVFDMTVRF